MEVENAAMLAAAREDAEGHARKVALLEGELVEVRQAREVAEEKFDNLSGTSADGARWLVVSEMEHQVQFVFPSADLGCQVMSRHCWPVMGEESPVSGDVGRCPPSC
jgi:hypothetical protein